MNVEAFRKDLQTLCEDLIKLNDRELASAYNTKLENLLDQHAPVTTRYVHVRKKVAWFDQDARKMKRELRHIERKWKKTGVQADRDHFRAAKKAYRKHLQQMKVVHFREAIHQAQGNNRQLFSVTMGLMGKKKDNPLPDMSSNEELAENFAEYFLDKIERIRDSLKDVPKYRPSFTARGEFSQY